LCNNYPLIFSCLDELIKIGTAYFTSFSVVKTSAPRCLKPFITAFEICSSV
jgi:hypothetical protein